jgi:DNA-directed RNA polymerase I subunit RPA2
MLVESMAGKSGALHGAYHNGTPFQFHEENRVIDHMGEQLRSAGYHYYGSEPLYNGISGAIIQADIFIGVVYYQRLRHMVSDKSQARSTGPVMAITRQPVKGRKKHGGIRLGEMERDALLSHGVAYVVHDRLMNCSDTHNGYVCSGCGGLITVHAMPNTSITDANQPNNKAPLAANGKGHIVRGMQYCSTCKSSAGVKPVRLPYVYRYLTNELAGMGIKLSLKFQ